ncbi:hypothetical protein HWV62_43529 [Athelia sp. TMB]|nr:hypothetical protein HWV62_43529 [Athelia sp. TMB]
MLPPTPRTPTKRQSQAPRSPGTPRRCKSPKATRLQGIKTTGLSGGQIKQKLVKKLKLTFDPDDWQVEAISRIKMGYDSIFCAPTGAGKSLVVEGLAALGGKGKALIVISPLKALEWDQVAQARAKGIDAVMINEDNTRTASLWKEAHSSAQLIYISPKMALSDSFTKLWKDSSFRGRLQAIVVDEAHCVDKWGGEEFWPSYRKLSELRNYTGKEVPYGNRPFWGLNIGCERPDLTYITRTLQNPENPILDLINFLPTNMDEFTRPEDINKGLIYLRSEGGCRQGVQTLRKLVPEHLCECIQPFSSDGSEAAKALVWDGFMLGRIRCHTMNWVHGRTWMKCSIIKSNLGDRKSQTNNQY